MPLRYKTKEEMTPFWKQFRKDHPAMTHYAEKMEACFEEKAGQTITPVEHLDHAFYCEEKYARNQSPVMRAAIDMAMPLDQRILKLGYLTTRF